MQAVRIVAVALIGAVAAFAPLIAAPTAPATRGAALARALGCTDCHGATLEGKVVFDRLEVATLYSSNLTRALPDYTDAQIAETLRTGVRPDGSKLWYMDAAPYAVMTAGDMRDLIAYLRTAPPAGPAHPRLRTGPQWAKAVAAGAAKPAADTLAAALSKPPASVGARWDRGRYIARTQCAGCHEPDLRGPVDPTDGDPPTLAIVAGYTLEEFQTLLRTGKASGNREVGEMSAASRQRLSAMPDADIRQLHGYLTQWAQR